MALCSLQPKLDRFYGNLSILLNMSILGRILSQDLTLIAPFFLLTKQSKFNTCANYPQGEKKGEENVEPL
jgi:hypothetical protein